MDISVHATRTEAGTYRVRLVLVRGDETVDPPPPDVLEAVTTAVWSLGFPSRKDTHSLEAAHVPREAVHTVAREMVRTAIGTVGLWREAEVTMPDLPGLPFLHHPLIGPLFGSP